MSIDTMDLISAVNASGTITIGGDLTVHRMGFGAMRITGKGVWGEPNDRPQAIDVLQRAIELGINFIDTADSYGPEVSEQLIAEALYPYPSGTVIATKAGFDRGGPDRWTMNGRPDHLRRSCDASLKRLKLERIDLFQLHRVDPAVPADEQFGTLKELQRAGKVRHVGLSEVSVAQIEHARSILPIASVQNRYSLSDRSHEDILAYCEREKIAFLPWFPLDAGKLTKAGGMLDQIAARSGATVGQLALAWLLKRSPAMLVIPGTSKVAHLDENVAAGALQLSDHDMTRLASVGGR